MQRLRAMLPGQQASSDGAANHSVTLEPEIGFQITIETQKQTTQSDGAFALMAKGVTPELNVHLIAARHLPSLFGFKIVQGYLIKVKLFPGSKRLDSSIQTNTWPKFNENFKFSLVPEIKPSLKHNSAFSLRHSANSQASSAFSSPEDLFAGQFVVFTVYALLELPATNFNRFNKTYRSLKDKSSSFVQRMVDTTTGATEEAKSENGTAQKGKKKTDNPRDAMPPLTISESRRNIGSVTCYLEPKLFKRNTRNGSYATEELWLPIKDITTTVTKATPSNNNNLTNSPKGIVELSLEVRDLNEPLSLPQSPEDAANGQAVTAPTATTPNKCTTPAAASTGKNWQRMQAEIKRKMGISNAASAGGEHNLVLRVTTARMRCSHKVKDELEATAGSVYVKTTVFEHGIYIDAWKSPNFYPSLSTKWDGAGGDEATLQIPLKSMEQLENIVVRTTLATKLKMGKKLVLGTVIIGSSSQSTSTGMEQLRLLQDSPLNERVAAWHCYH